MAEADCAGRRRSRTPRNRQREAAIRTVGQAIRAGASSYNRMRDLPALIRLDPFGSQLLEGKREVEAIVARLERALRGERQKARSGHWTYDLNRHIALRQAWLAESMRLEALARRR
jgi:hypothetical protein